MDGATVFRIIGYIAFGVGYGLLGVMVIRYLTGLSKRNKELYGPPFVKRSR